MSLDDLIPDENEFSEAVLLITASGSQYFVARDRDGSWWLSGDNVANPISCALPQGPWRIRPPTPWPPQLGGLILLMAPPDMPHDDPQRVPGGGKQTSPISVIRQRLSASCSPREALTEPAS